MTIPISADTSSSVILELLYELKVRDAMSTDLVTATGTESLGALQRMMKARMITGVPIVTDQRLVGIISVDDILEGLSGGYIGDKAEAWMTRNVIVLEEDMPLAFAISSMEKYRFGRFPVLSKERRLVGIITSRDILVRLLVAINRRVEQLENRGVAGAGNSAETGETSGPDAGIQEFRTRRFDFENAGKPTSTIKKALRDRGVPPKILRRVAIACYELEMNQVCHSLGGTLTAAVTDQCFTLVAADDGPGIPDVEAALTEGFSTAGDWIRSLGFGAGMGLPNTRRVSDGFQISSSEAGTRVEIRISLNPEVNCDD